MHDALDPTVVDAAGAGIAATSAALAEARPTRSAPRCGPRLISYRGPRGRPRARRSCDDRRGLPAARRSAAGHLRHRLLRRALVGGRDGWDRVQARLDVVRREDQLVLADLGVLVGEDLRAPLSPARSSSRRQPAWRRPPARRGNSSSSRPRTGARPRQASSSGRSTSARPGGIGELEPRLSLGAARRHPNRPCSPTHCPGEVGV